MADWEVAKTQGVCAGCGVGLEPKQEYFAGLVEAAGGPDGNAGEEAAAKGAKDRAGQGGNGCGGFERRDYCEKCWEQDRPEVFCFWKTRVPEPAEKKKLLVDNEVLLDFFERLSGQDEPAKVKFRFVLALILMRKRILKYELTELREGQEYWIMGQVREQKKHEVLNPRLDDGDIQGVSEQLSAILQSEL